MGIPVPRSSEEYLVSDTLEVVGACPLMRMTESSRTLQWEVPNFSQLPEKHYSETFSWEATPGRQRWAGELARKLHRACCCGREGRAAARAG